MSLEVSPAHHVGPLKPEHILFIEAGFEYVPRSNDRSHLRFLQEAAAQAAELDKQFIQVSYPNGTRMYQIRLNLNPGAHGRKYLLRVPLYGVDDFRKEDE